MAVTPNRSYPLVNLTDQPNGPAQIDALATAVDTDVAGIASKLNNLADGAAVVMTTTTPNQIVFQAITFSKTFTTVPAITATARTTDPLNTAVGIANPTTTGFTLYFSRTTAGSNSVDWIAVNPN